MPEIRVTKTRDDNLKAIAITLPCFQRHYTLIVIVVVSTGSGKRCNVKSLSVKKRIEFSQEWWAPRSDRKLIDLAKIVINQMVA
jgi:hypothetical protein